MLFHILPPPRPAKLPQYACVVIFLILLFLLSRYLKLQKGQRNEVDVGDVSDSLKSNVSAKYVILEEMDEQEDNTWKDLWKY